MPAGEVKQELWAKEVIKKMTALDKDTFLEGIPNDSRLVENDIIHTHKLLNKPAVTINGVLPVAVMRLQFEDEPISLDTLRTENTAISDDDLYATSIDKVKVASEAHTEALNEKRVQYAAWGLAPTSDTPDTPVIVTTGAVDPVTGEKAITNADILKAKNNFDNLGIPETDRVMVLSTTHFNQLIDLDPKLQDRYDKFLEGGLPPRILGFTVYSYVSNPYYTSGKVKKAFGSIPTVTDRQASFFFHKKNAFKAWGSTKIFSNKAENDVYNEEQLMHIKQRAITRLILQINAGAIIGG